MAATCLRRSGGGQAAVRRRPGGGQAAGRRRAGGGQAAIGRLPLTVSLAPRRLWPVAKPVPARPGGEREFLARASGHGAKVLRRGRDVRVLVLPVEKVEDHRRAGVLDAERGKGAPPPLHCGRREGECWSSLHVAARRRSGGGQAAARRRPGGGQAAARRHPRRRTGNKGRASWSRLRPGRGACSKGAARRRPSPPPATRELAC